jgi:DNA-binding MarR family transcriptional regulator
MSSDQLQDHVDHILEQWAQQRPDLDVSPMGIIGRMSRLSRFLERSIAAVLTRYGLNEPQFAVLAALRRAGPPHTLSPTDLYNGLLVSSGAMTNRLERLAAAGLVERVPDPADGRSLLAHRRRAGRARRCAASAAAAVRGPPAADQVARPWPRPGRYWALQPPSIRRCCPVT